MECSSQSGRKGQRNKYRKNNQRKENIIYGNMCRVKLKKKRCIVCPEAKFRAWRAMCQDQDGSVYINK